MEFVNFLLNTVQNYSKVVTRVQCQQGPPMAGTSAKNKLLLTSHTSEGHTPQYEDKNSAIIKH